MCCGRKIRDVSPQLTTPENHETNDPSPPNFTFFDGPDVPFGPHSPPPPEPLAPGPPGLPEGWPPAPSLAGDGERVRTGNTLRDRLHPRSLLPEPQLIPIPMSDGDDDQPPQDERQRERSRSRERVPPHSSPHASQQPEPVVPPSKVQQIQPRATQGSDEDSAYVDPQNRVSNHSLSPQGQKGSRRQGPQKQKGNETVADSQPSESPKAKKHKSMDSDEDGEEPENEPGTSSTSHPTVPVLPYHQGPAASCQGPDVLDNSEDEDSDYGDE